MTYTAACAAAAQHLVDHRDDVVYESEIKRRMRLADRWHSLFSPIIPDTARHTRMNPLPAGSDRASIVATIQTAITAICGADFDIQDAAMEIASELAGKPHAIAPPMDVFEADVRAYRILVVAYVMGEFTSTNLWRGISPHNMEIFAIFFRGGGDLNTFDRHIGAGQSTGPRSSAQRQTIRDTLTEVCVVSPYFRLYTLS